ncbi:rrna-processing protein efg1 [Diaporthe amygdali]|uniref:rrna-processing protein efg1 n=1 Tax=Phomopsis amygdali TaxID=1214568 RepID=UPI0022FF41CC|nr:rrna-processing protein efg1 [Diaporthe amygdali]KAJ0109252.1 rrna-processing protein efg1 [Diaporthe amygdali]
MTLPNGNDPPFPNPLYQEVKAWVAEQEAYELTNQAPAHLTDAQRVFLDSFRAKSPLPEIGQVDYVSLLCRYRQANPTGKKITFAEGMHSERSAEGPPQWTCTVELSESLAHEPAIKRFPAAGFGFDETGCPPFGKKKDAKQYAAKCAIDWLITQSLMPSNLQDVTSPKQQLPFPRPLPIQASQSAKRPNDGTNGVLSPPPKRKTKGTNGAVDVDDNSLPATQRVTTLCHSMKLRAPTYRLTNSDPRANYIFDGYPDFGEDSDEFPEDLGKVTGVAGKDGARQEIAELVLEHLLVMHRERTEKYEMLSKVTGSQRGFDGL